MTSRKHLIELAERAIRLRLIRESDTPEDPNGKWVTMNGVHVFLNGAGQITKGPEGMTGKTPDELSEPGKSNKVEPSTPSENAKLNPFGMGNNHDEMEAHARKYLEGRGIRVGSKRAQSKLGAREIKAPDIEYLDPADIVAQDRVKQFKAGANEKTGETEPLEGAWDARGTGPVQIWEGLDGKREVISGRHRLAHAQRNKASEIPVQIYREKDGFTLDQAKALDAELNIRDGNGSVADYARYFSTAPNMTEEEAKGKGLLGRSKGQMGWTIGKNGIPDLVAAHAAKRISDAQASTIARLAPHSQKMQQLGLALAEQDKSAEAIADILQVALVNQRGKAAEDDQLELFGNDDSAIQEMATNAAKARELRRGILAQVNAVSGAAKNPEAARKLGVDVSDPEGIKKKVAELTELGDRWRNWHQHPDLVSQVFGREMPQAPAPAPTAPEAPPQTIEQPKSAEQQAADDEQRLMDKGNDKTPSMFGDDPEPSTPPKIGEEAPKFGEPSAPPPMDLFGNPTKRVQNGPETMPGLFGDAVTVDPQKTKPQTTVADDAAKGLDWLDQKQDQKTDGTGEMFGSLFSPGAPPKLDDTGATVDDVLGLSPDKPAMDPKQGKRAIQLALNSHPGDWMTGEDLDKVAGAQVRQELEQAGLIQAGYDQSGKRHYALKGKPMAAGLMNQWQANGMSDLGWGTTTMAPDKRETMDSFTQGKNSPGVDSPAPALEDYTPPKGFNIPRSMDEFDDRLTKATDHHEKHNKAYQALLNAQGEKPTLQANGQYAVKHPLTGEPVNFGRDPQTATQFAKDYFRSQSQIALARANRHRAEIQNLREFSNAYEGKPFGQTGPGEAPPVQTPPEPASTPATAPAAPPTVQTPAQNFSPDDQLTLTGPDGQKSDVSFRGMHNGKAVVLSKRGIQTLVDPAQLAKAEPAADPKEAAKRQSWLQDAAEHSKGPGAFWDENADLGKFTGLFNNSKEEFLKAMGGQSAPVQTPPTVAEAPPAPAQVGPSTPPPVQTDTGKRAKRTALTKAGPEQIQAEVERLTRAMGAPDISREEYRRLYKQLNHTKKKLQDLPTGAGGGGDSAKPTPPAPAADSPQAPPAPKVNQKAEAKLMDMAFRLAHGRMNYEIDKNKAKGKVDADNASRIRDHLAHPDGDPDKPRLDDATVQARRAKLDDYMRKHGHEFHEQTGEYKDAEWHKKYGDFTTRAATNAHQMPLGDFLEGHSETHDELHPNHLYGLRTTRPLGLLDKLELASGSTTEPLNHPAVKEEIEWQGRQGQTLAKLIADHRKAAAEALRRGEKLPPEVMRQYGGLDHQYPDKDLNERQKISVWRALNFIRENGPQVKHLRDKGSPAEVRAAVDKTLWTGAYQALVDSEEYLFHHDVSTDPETFGHRNGEKLWDGEPPAKPAKPEAEPAPAPSAPPPVQTAPAPAQVAAGDSGKRAKRQALTNAGADQIKAEVERLTRAMGEPGISREQYRKLYKQRNHTQKKLDAMGGGSPAPAPEPAESPQAGAAQTPAPPTAPSGFVKPTAPSPPPRLYGEKAPKGLKSNPMANESQLTEDDKAKIESRIRKFVSAKYSPEEVLKSLGVNPRFTGKAEFKDRLDMMRNKFPELYETIKAKPDILGKDFEEEVLQHTGGEAKPAAPVQTPEPPAQVGPSTPPPVGETPARGVEMLPDGKMKTKDGTIWVRAKAGGEHSPVTDQHYKGGQWMPIHGMSVKGPEVPPTGMQIKPEGTPTAKQKDQGLMKGPRAPLSPEEIERRRQRAEDQAHWDAAKKTPLEKLRWLGDSPNSHAFQKGFIDNTKMKAFAREHGEEALKRIADHFKGEHQKRLDEEWAQIEAGTHPKGWKVGPEKTGINERGFVGGTIPDKATFQKWNDEHYQFYLDNRKEWHTKKDLKATPSIAEVQFWLDEHLGKNKSPQGFRETGETLSKLVAAPAQAKPPEPKPAEGDRPYSPEDYARHTKLQNAINEARTLLNNPKSPHREAAQANLAKAETEMAQLLKRAKDAGWDQRGGFLQKVEAPSAPAPAGDRANSDLDSILGETAPAPAPSPPPQPWKRADSPDLDAMMGATPAPAPAPAPGAGLFAGGPTPPPAIGGKVDQSGFINARPTAVGNWGEDVEHSGRARRGGEKNSGMATLAKSKEVHGGLDVSTINENPHRSMNALVAHLALETLPKVINPVSPKYHGKGHHPYSQDQAQRDLDRVYQASHKAAQDSLNRGDDFMRLVGNVRAAAMNTARQINEEQPVGWRNFSNPVARHILDNTEPRMNMRAKNGPVFAAYKMLRNHAASTGAEPGQGDLAKDMTLIKSPEFGAMVSKLVGGGNAVKLGLKIPQKKTGIKMGDVYTNKVYNRQSPHPEFSDHNQAADWLQKTAGLRGNNFGNSMPDGERREHLTKAAGAFQDLSDVTGLPIEAASMKGALALGLGSHGVGGLNAGAAAYFPNLKLLNLTRRAGVGALAHEWAHALDNFVGGDGQLKGDGKVYASEQVHAIPKEKKEIAEAYWDLRRNMGTWERKMRASSDWKYESPAQQQYWGSPSEMFARAFEKYTQHKLAKQGRKNTYLSGVRNHEYWPDDKDIAEMAPAFDRFFAAIKKHYFSGGEQA
jgi:hypothetical protein